MSLGSSILQYLPVWSETLQQRTLWSSTLKWRSEVNYSILEPSEVSFFTKVASVEINCKVETSKASNLILVDFKAMYSLQRPLVAATALWIPLASTLKSLSGIL